MLWQSTSADPPSQFLPYWSHFQSTPGLADRLEQQQLSHLQVWQVFQVVIRGCPVSQHSLQLFQQLLLHNRVR
jgi:hypothetical protein